MSPRLRVFRRSLAVGTLWVAGMAGLVLTSPSASGQDAVEPGLGSAYAQGVKVDPRSGRLSFGITYGMALAGHQNTVAVAEARSVDLGVIGTTLAAQKCNGDDPTLPKEDQPQPLVARSTEDASDRGRTETENTVEKRVRATGEPFAEAVAVTAAAGDASAVHLGTTSSRTISGIIDGKRQARAITEVSTVTFGGGVVVLRGLRWDALWQSAPDEVVRGSFSIDGIEVGGQPVASPAGDALGGLAEANAVLRPLGFTLDPPAVRNEAGISFVDPLRIGVIPSQLRESIIGPVFNEMQPVREGLFDAIIEFDCTNASYLTVADIVLGSVTGAGSLNIELGGVTARSSELETTSFLGGLGGGSLPPLPSPSLGGGTTGGSSIGTVGTTGTVGSGTAGAGTESDDAGPADDGAEEAALPAVEQASGSRGGPLVAVGLGGLLLLAVLAEADRRKMRRAQRSIPMEVMA